MASGMCSYKVIIAHSSRDDGLPQKLSHLCVSRHQTGASALIVDRKIMPDWWKVRAKPGCQNEQKIKTSALNQK